MQIPATPSAFYDSVAAPTCGLWTL